ncbi:MAG: MmgE/PrpD family protein [Candidatus Dormibacteraeota bacterium]|uniref:MmgE/PrpD family protein n=1 Tax=Candidatus Aeolococcus gillhamiae TaxID=3127015 RepID=A0A934MYP5_9BACT|nr:MmgE/PrpD family protein [Candidatus Dormibacteraeota bacterium]
MTTVALAERYSRLEFADLPAPVVNRAIELAIDTLGVAIGGQFLESSTLTSELVADMGGKPESTVVGGGRVPACLAVLANATIAHGLELDDVDNASSLHPGTVVIPTALALGEATSASGSDVVAAIVAGYDAMIRIGRAAGAVQQYSKGFHPTATCGVFGAAITAGRLLQLDGDRLAHALGIAGSFSAGNLEYMANGAWTKRLQVGGAAQSGTLAALMSARGFTGPTTILEGKHGFLQAHADTPDPAMLTDGLADPFAILDVSIKPFACCRYSQTPVDAVLELIEHHTIAAERVTRVDVGLVNAGIPIVAEPREQKLSPQNSVDAQFSLPYAVAVALQRGGAFVEEFSDQAVWDPAVRRLMPLVHVHPDAALDAFYPAKWPADVTISMDNGEHHRLRVMDCRGDPGKPILRRALEDKFRRLAAAAMGSVAMDQILERVAGLAALDDIAQLTELFRSHPDRVALAGAR